MLLSRQKRNEKNRNYKKARYDQLKHAQEKLKEISNNEDDVNEHNIQQLQLLASKREQNHLLSTLKPSLSSLFGVPYFLETTSNGIYNGKVNDEKIIIFSIRTSNFSYTNSKYSKIFLAF
jgi:hypothetical protein